MVYWPDTIAGPAVSPATLHLAEACDAALFPSQAAAWSVDELHPWFRVYSKVQEQTHHLPVRQNSWLRRACTREHPQSHC